MASDCTPEEDDDPSLCNRCFVAEALLRSNVVVHANSHGRELGVEVLEHKRNGHGGCLATANKLGSLAVLPNIQFVHIWKHAFDFLGAATASGRGLGADARHRHLRRQQRATRAANRRLRVVRAVQQPILQQERGSVSNQSVSLHLSHSDTSVSLSSLNRLHGERVHRTSRSDLEFIVHHVSQPLVVDNPDVNVCTELLTGCSRIKRLITVEIVSGLEQLFSKVVRRSVRLTELPWSGILGNSMQSSCLSGQRLHKHTDGHSRWESVRVDDDVWLNTRFTERHVDLRPFS